MVTCESPKTMLRVTKTNCCESPKPTADLRACPALIVVCMLQWAILIRTNVTALEQTVESF